MSNRRNRAESEAQSVIEGYLVKRAVKSGRNWKRRYFVLRTDGILGYCDRKGDAPKKTIVIGANTQINLIREGDSKHQQGGFSLTGPTHQPLFLKAEDSRIAEGWMRALSILVADAQAKANGVVQQKNHEGVADRKQHLEAFASTSKRSFLQRTLSKKSSRFLRSSTRSSSGTSLTGAPQGYTLRVGDSDCFVKVDSWEYYSNAKACATGEPAIGYASLQLLV